jgi:hypothetical protein
MIITCKEDYEKLPDTVKTDLWCAHNDAEFWDIDEVLDKDYYLDPENPCVKLRELENYSVDTYHATLKPRLLVDVPVALCSWYHWCLARCSRTEVVSSELAIFNNHYWMLMSAYKGFYLNYQNGYLNIDDLGFDSDNTQSVKFMTFLNDFIDFMQGEVESWISNAESYVSGSYEDACSEERVIDNLICNEIEVDYED